MDQPINDNKIKDEDQNITAHPSGAEGVPASVESIKDNVDVINEHDSHPEVEVSRELKEAGVRKEQPKSLRSDLQEPIAEAANASLKTSPAQKNNNSIQASEKEDVTNGGTWIDAFRKKISLFKEMFKSSKKTPDIT